MEIVMECGAATVFILDSAGYEVITFDDVKVKGAVNTCATGGTGIGQVGFPSTGAPVFAPVATIEQ
jgi:hypothetical protein